MGQITAKVVEDSVSEQNVRLTTLQLAYPRFIHAEFMTHRMFSRNASSSRAIPANKMIEQVRNDPAMPVHWGKNQPGMQAREELSGDELTLVQENWKNAARSMSFFADCMANNNAHKQIVNRILEPFQIIHVVVTATEWNNFFHLRCHPDAQPEIQALACAMKSAMGSSTPVPLSKNEWHLPYVSDEEKLIYRDEVLLKISTARCARVSYLKHDGTNPSVADDMTLYNRLVSSSPIHASPAEHQARPMDANVWSANFRGWLQHRQLIEGNAPYQKALVSRQQPK